MIPNAVDVPPTSPSEVAASRDEVLFLAHLRPRKNVMLFYAACLIAAQRSPNAVFTIAGPDGGDLHRLRAALAENDADGRIQYVGSVSSDAARSMTASAGIYCLPAVNEPFPISVLDAWAADTPVIMTRECHISDLAESYNAAMVCDPTAPALADAIVSLLTSASSRDNYVTGAAKLVQSELQPSHILKLIRSGYGMAEL